MNVNEIEKATEIIKNSKYLIALTGAGVSAESGIPTFRGKDGLWNKYKPEELATPQAFNANPELVWEWYAWRMKIVFDANPNPAHHAFAELEKMGILKCLITQNVDDLHERAGSKNVLHLHGSLRIVKCISCDYQFYAEKPIEFKPLPTCPECNNLLRPGVVWFGEMLPSEILSKAFDEVERSDVIIVAGTSAVVQPAASLPLIVRKNKGKIIEINPNETPLTAIADVSIRGKAGEVLSKIVELLKE
ncbi:MAG: NAD-dependent deacylase [Archaeoglobaceae archaeon]|nr:NAD-dependent deacylase [Archaeoglobaceae archaeon]